jgi:hypothetical protein
MPRQRGICFSNHHTRRRGSAAFAFSKIETVRMNSKRGEHP